MIHVTGQEPEAQQGVLFDEDRRKQEKEKIERQIRKKSDELKEILKNCSAYMKLLKDGPKTVEEIFFECQKDRLAIDHLEMLNDRATRLAEDFVEAAKACALIHSWQEDLRELTGEVFVMNGQAGSTEIEAEDAAIDAEIADIYEDDPAEEGTEEPAAAEEAEGEKPI